MITVMRDNSFVGIGQTNPVCSLDVIGGPIRTYTGSQIARFILGPAPSGTNLDYSSLIESVSTTGSNYASTLRFYTHGSGSTAGDPTLAMTIDSIQRVGIGVAPSYPLHVGITGSIATTVKYFNGASTGIESYSGPFSCSIYAVSDIITSGSIAAVSDKRAKVIEEPLSESYIDLVDKIQVHQYSWIDKIEKGERKKIGFFAQEVEKVVPDAVNRMTGVIPAIYRQANAFTETTITVTNHGITTEKKLEVVDPENGKTKIDIVRVIDADNLEVKFEKVPKDKLFVMGAEVDDLRNLNHDYLMAISFGAVKEIIEENKSLRKQISCLTSRLDALVDKLK
jgi:hypothetical protein